MTAAQHMIKGTLCALVLCFAASGSQAAATDPLIEGAKVCTKYISRYEREYGIPTHLLAAIAATESGRYHKGLGIMIPWPWTINAQGKGYYYDTKQEAVAALKKFRARGIKSVDVGCMQVNMQHHPEAFASLDRAFEPEQNVAYAASFLRTLYQDAKSWKKAASDYHSKTPSRGKKYVGNVYSSWYNIIEKLRVAKIQKVAEAPATTVAAVKAEPKKVTASVKPAPERKPITPRMKVIELSDKQVSPKNAVVVVRPAIRVVDAPATVTIARVEPAALTVAETTSAPEILTVERSGTVVRDMDKQAGSKKTGPTFIFSN